MGDCVEEEDGAESVVSGCLSMKCSSSTPSNFGNEPGPSDTKRRSDVSLEEQPSRSRTRPGLQTDDQTCTVQIIGGQHEHKISLKQTCERVTEGSDQTGNATRLNAKGSETSLKRIYTAVYITDGESEEASCVALLADILETPRKKLPSPGLRSRDDHIFREVQGAISPKGRIVEGSAVTRPAISTNVNYPEEVVSIDHCQQHNGICALVVIIEGFSKFEREDTTFPAGSKSPAQL